MLHGMSVIEIIICVHISHFIIVEFFWGYQVCVIMADFWTFFSEVKLSATKLQTLGFLPSVETLETFWKLCEHRLVAAGNTFQFQFSFMKFLSV
jgi:hypothetical protein